MNRRTWLAMAAVTAIAVSACSPSTSPSPSSLTGSPSASGGVESPGASPNGSPGSSSGLTTIRVQLSGPIDGEFAGIIAAQKLGYFGDDNLTVTLLPGDPDPAKRPSSFYSPGTSGPEFTISDVASVLQAREHGSDLVDIAQLFQRSGTVALTWKKDNLTDLCGLKGKKVGLWPSPADLELVSSLTACPLAATDFTRVDATRDVSAFLAHSVDALQATTYDQVAQVLEATNPATSQQYTPNDVVALPPTDRHATLQDAVFASAAWLQAAGNRDTAVAFIRGVIRGWVYCRDHQEDCVQFTTAAGSGLGTSHTRWMINEVNSLIWPSPDGIGSLDPVQWQQTITVATGAGILTKAPSQDAYDDTLVPDAVAILQGKDLQAKDFQKETVLVAPGGK